MIVSRRSATRLVAPLGVAAAVVGTLFGTHTIGPDHGSSRVLGVTIKPLAAGGNGGGNNGNGNGNTGSGGNPAKGFTISGTITNLVPGVNKTVALRISNPNSQAIRVQQLTVTASGGTDACGNDMLLLGSATTPTTGSMSLDLVVGAKSSTKSSGTPLDVQFPVKLSSSAPNGCKDFTWTITFSGSAVQA